MDNFQRASNMPNIDCTLGSSATRHNKIHRDNHFQDLLFIHQFSNDDHRTCHGPDRRTKGSYVQRNIHRAKRMQASSKLMDPKAPKNLKRLGKNYAIWVRSVPQHFSSHDQETTSVQSSVSVAHLPMFQARVSKIQRNNLMSEEIRLLNKPADNDTVDFDLTLGSSCSEPPRFHPQENSPTTLLDTGLIGGLNQVEVFRILLPSSAKECFRYYLETLVPKIFPVFPIAREHCQRVLQAAASSQELLFSIAALSSATLFTARRRTNTETSHSQRQSDSNYTVSALNELWFKGNAVKLVNIKITHSNSVKSDTVLYTVTCLLLAAIITGNHQEMNTHALGLRKLIELRGNYDGLPVHTVTAILSTFYISCTIAETPPIPTPLVAMELSDIRTTFLAAFESYPSLREIGCGFADSNFTMCLSQSLGQACEDMRAFVILAEYLRRSQRAPTVFQKAYFHSKYLNCHFLATWSPFEVNTSDRQEPFRLALLIFWNANTQLNGTDSMLYRTLTTRLKTSLEKTRLETFWREHRSILLWIMLLGAFISRGQVEHSWFVAQMAKGLMLKRMQDWRWTKTMLQRLFYIENIFQQSFEQSWKEAYKLRLLHNTG